MKNLGCLILLTVSGCADVGTPTTRYDRFAGVTINSTGHNELPTGLMGGTMLYFDLRQEITAGRTNYFVILGTLFPPQRLEVLTDRNRLAFSTGRQHIRGSLDYWLYPASERQIKALCSATNMDLRVTGFQEETVERRVPAPVLGSYRAFATKFLP